ncbi:class I SAM-dependent methyltransferase [Candidatus Woesearchaeota archaeon]|nr:class I SAM-dependent methyltransferase [Candidatus Woesearchaeota archaeon]
MNKKKDYEYYEETSKGYEELHGEEQRRKLTTIKNNLTQEFHNVLDIGAGTGISTEFFNNVTCLEPSKKMLQEGLKKRKFETINDYAENLEKYTKENQYDLILCVTVIHHFHDLNKVLQEIKKTAKKEATIIITMLKKARNTEELIKKITKSFTLKKQIEDPTDIILFLENNETNNELAE